MINNVCLFNFSKISSKNIFYISDYNSFNYNFPQNDEKNNKKRKKISRYKNSIQHYIKNVNVSIPSNDILKKDTFLNDFYNNYDNSFANFCGISPKIYKEIYEKNRFIPEINRMGDIIVDITKIVRYLDSFSGLKQLKKQRLIRKIHKIPPKYKKLGNNLGQKNVFQTNNDKKNDNNNIIPLDEDVIEGKIIDRKIFKEKTNSSNSNSNNESDINDKDIKPNDKTLLNIKRKLKNISISKINTAPFDIKIRSKIINDLNNSIEDKNYIFKNKKNESDNNLNKDINKEIFSLSNDNIYKSSQHHKLDFKFSEISDKNNIFNFTLNDIHDLSNISQKNNLNIFTPLMNKEVENNNLILSPNKSLFSPYNFSSMKYNSLLSPNLSVNSPYNNMFNYVFNFRNNDINDTMEENNNNIYNYKEKIENENDKGTNTKKENDKNNDKEKKEE